MPNELLNKNYLYVNRDPEYTDIQTGAKNFSLVNCYINLLVAVIRQAKLDVSNNQVSRDNKADAEEFLNDSEVLNLYKDFIFRFIDIGEYKVSKSVKINRKVRKNKCQIN